MIREIILLSPRFLGLSQFLQILIREIILASFTYCENEKLLHLQKYYVFIFHNQSKQNSAI